jgi:hypothetical protein
MAIILRLLCSISNKLLQPDISIGIMFPKAAELFAIGLFFTTNATDTLYKNTLMIYNR